MTTTTGAPAHEALEALEAASLRDHDRRVERLLAEAEAATGPVAWPRVEALVAALVELYGLGLERLLACARQAASADLDERLAADEVVASLLLVHGLHPVPLATRIERALLRLHAELPGTAPLALVGIEGGIATLRAASGSALPPSTQVVARAIEREAPDLEGIRVDGGGAAPSAGGIVPVERLRRGGAR